MEKPCYRQKTPLVIGGTRTQVLADSMAIAASALNHCTKTIAMYNVMVSQIYIRSKVHNLNTLRDGLSDSFSKLNIHSFFLKIKARLSP